MYFNLRANSWNGCSVNSQDKWGVESLIFFLIEYILKKLIEPDITYQSSVASRFSKVFCGLVCCWNQLAGLYLGLLLLFYFPCKHNRIQKKKLFLAIMYMVNHKMPGFSEFGGLLTKKKWTLWIVKCGKLLTIDIKFVDCSNCLVDKNARIGHNVVIANTDVCS